MWVVDGGWCPTKLQGGLKIAHLLGVDMCCILHGGHEKKEKEGLAPVPPTLQRITVILLHTERIAETPYWKRMVYLLYVYPLPRLP